MIYGRSTFSRANKSGNTDKLIYFAVATILGASSPLCLHTRALWLDLTPDAAVTIDDTQKSWQEGLEQLFATLQISLLDASTPVLSSFQQSALDLVDLTTGCSPSFSRFVDSAG